MTDFRIRSVGGTWSVRAGGAIIAETRNALELSDPYDKDIIYFPREDVAMAFLDPSENRFRDNGKGEAINYSIVTKSRVLEDAAWSFEAPLPAAERLKDHLAFRVSDTVVVEQI